MSQENDQVFKEYGQMHRMFLQAMMTRGIVSSKDFKELFTLICKRCNVEVPKQGKELGEAHRVFLFAINKKIEDKCSMKILKVLDEESRTKMSSLMLANKIDRSNDTNKLTIKDQVTFAPHEMEYLKLIVDNIMEHPLRELKQTKALNIAKDVNKNNKKIQAQEAELILQKFKDHKWLGHPKFKDNTDDQGTIVLSTRFIFEMEPYLKEVYPNEVGKCSLCKKIIIRSIQCFNDDCNCQYHAYCANDNTLRSKCLKCQSELPDRRSEDYRQSLLEASDDRSVVSNRSGQKKRKIMESSESESE